jgi:hypothetical protein
MYNTYILSYSPFSEKYTVPQLVAFIKAHAGTYQFYIATAGTMFVKTDWQLLPLIESYHNFFAGDSYVISQVFPNLMGGGLPQYAWDWINAPSPPPLLEQPN